MQAPRPRSFPYDLQPFLMVALTAAVVQLAGGCAAPLPVRAVRHDIRVSLDPASNHLRGQAALHLTRTDDTPPPGDRVVVEFELNPALNVATVDCDSAVVRAHTARRT